MRVPVDAVALQRARRRKFELLRDAVEVHVKGPRDGGLRLLGPEAGIGTKHQMSSAAVAKLERAAEASKQHR